LNLTQEWQGLQWETHQFLGNTWLKYVFLSWAAKVLGHSAISFATKTPKPLLCHVFVVVFRIALRQAT
jgi:hypothetical protein